MCHAPIHTSDTCVLKQCQLRLSLDSVSASSLLALQMAHKGHQRTGSAPPTLPLEPSSKGRHLDLQGIPEESPVSANGSSAESPHMVRFPDQDASVSGKALLLTSVLESPNTSVASTPRRDSSVILHGPADETIQESAVQPVPGLNSSGSNRQGASIAGTRAAPDYPLSMNSDTVEIPPTPERPIHNAHVSEIKPSPESFSSIVRTPPHTTWPLACVRFDPS